MDKQTWLQELKERLRRAQVAASVGGLLGWDEQVNLPAGAAGWRGEQLGAVAEWQQERATDTGIGRALDALEGRGDLEEEERILVGLARRDYERATRLPGAFVGAKAKAASEAYHAWVKAKEAKDFGVFAPHLKRQLEMAKEEAERQGWGERPYDYAIDKHDPGMTEAAVVELFDELKTGLVPLARTIDEKEAARGTEEGRGGEERLFKGFAVAEQKAFLEEVVERLGFDFDRGRIDVSLHPFCEGSGDDVRMTTRFDADNPLDSLFSSIHETGHGLYEQGLPEKWRGTPLGENAGMAVHESQSRLWENQVGRSRAFWRFFEPRFRARFGAKLAGVDGESLHRAINAVRPTLIRVDADEVHYNLHIVLRFELERRLFSGELAVEELPEAWNGWSRDLLGLTPPDAARGVLQDVHWSGGAFGYFPSYCLGNMLAAQMWESARAELPGWEEAFERGEFGRLLTWLRDKVHQQGRREALPELAKRVTGQALGPQALLVYLRERYDR